MTLSPLSTAESPTRYAVRTVKECTDGVIMRPSLSSFRYWDCPGEPTIREPNSRCRDTATAPIALLTHRRRSRHCDPSSRLRRNTQRCLSLTRERFHRSPVRRTLDQQPRRKELTQSQSEQDRDCRKQIVPVTGNNGCPPADD